MIFHIIYIAGIDETVREVRAIGGKCTGYKVDISNKDDVYKAADAIRRDTGDVCRKWNGPFHWREYSINK